MYNKINTTNNILIKCVYEGNSVQIRSVQRIKRNILIISYWQILSLLCIKLVEFCINNYVNACPI